MNYHYPITQGPFQFLFNYIEQHATEALTATDKNLILTSYQHIYLKQQQYLLQEGGIGATFAFIVKGALRLYVKDEKGQKHTARFALENCWIGDYESFTTHCPSKYYIEAVEDASLLVINKEQFLLLTHQVTAYRQMIDALDHNGLMANHKRIQAAISMSSEERCTDLLKCHPEFFERFSPTMIASYLGITPDALNRYQQNLEAESGKGNTDSIY